MGYTSLSTPITLLQSGGDFMGHKYVIPAALTDFTPLGPAVTIMAFTEPLKAAYLDMWVGTAQDTSGAENYAYGYFAVSTDAGATYHHSILFQVIVPANAIIPVGWYYGSTNIKQYITSGATMTVKIDNAEADANNLVLSNLSAVLRLVWG